MWYCFMLNLDEAVTALGDPVGIVVTETNVTLTDKNSGQDGL